MFSVQFRPGRAHSAGPRIKELSQDHILTTKRSKRWNGSLDSLTPEFLKEVIEKMQSYGDRVQFDLPGKPPRPNYQVINSADRKMGFDDRHLLLRLNENGNISDNLTTVFSLESIKTVLNGGGKSAASRSRVARVSSAGTGVRRSAAPVAAPVVDTLEREKYEYFKSNRDMLPEGIAKFSQDISELMKSGASAEDAFAKIIKQHFQD